MGKTNKTRKLKKNRIDTIMQGLKKMIRVHLRQRIK